MSLEGSASVAVICLAVVLLLAASTKFRDSVSTAEEFRQLGLPKAAARLVPLAEVVTALTLLVLPSWGSVFAFFLLAAFTSILFSLVRSDSGLSCACFGQATKGPVGKLDLLRNAVLLTFAIVGSTIDGLSRPHPFDVLVICVVCIVAVGGPLISNRVQTSQQRS